MKTFTRVLVLTGVLLGTLFAAEIKADHPAHKGSPEFERMKSLIGVWKGQSDMGKGPMEMTVEYRLTGGGSAIEERFMADTPMEMITVYHDRQGKLALTHYCSLGNQPAMKLTSADEKSLQLDFDSSCGIDSGKEQHMHSLTVTFDDADTLTQRWTMFVDGKPQTHPAFVLKRVKA